MSLNPESEDIVADHEAMVRGLTNFVLDQCRGSRHPDVRLMESEIPNWIAIEYTLPPQEGIRSGYTEVIAGVRPTSVPDGVFLQLAWITDMELVNGNELIGGSPVRELGYFLPDPNLPRTTLFPGVIRMGEDTEPVALNPARLMEDLTLLRPLVRLAGPEDVQ